MRTVFVVAVFALGTFLMVDGLAGIALRHMWTFRRGGEGVCHSYDRDALVLGIVYLLLGVLVLGLGVALRAVLFPVGG
ncbi:MAG: hypothetical protein ACHQQS_06520 [Thermoanaerobaculales bacterium]|jgi:hypothetical protein